MSVKFVSKNKIKKIIKSKIKATKIILDIGSGIRPQTLVRPKVHICVDVCSEYINHLKRHYPKRSLVLLQGDWGEIINIFPDKSVDTIFLLDFIEHLDKEEGKTILKKCEYIAMEQIVVYTPLGFLPQIHIEGRKDRWEMNGSYWQQHRSGWHIEDFDDTWDITCVKEYHFDDGYGHTFDKPFGIIWAIKNLHSIDDNSGRKLLFSHKLKKLIPAKVRTKLKRFYKSYIKTTKENL